MKILVVEDTEDSRVLLVDQLEIQGYEVESAINGVEALEKVCASPSDIIISDILMPEMDGYEFCQRIKKDPQLKTIPFIFYTATYTEPSDQQLALSMGAARFIVKPEDPAKLIQIVEEVAAEHKERDSRSLIVQRMENDDFSKLHVEVVSKKLQKKVRELEEQKEQLQIITDAMPELIAEIDASGCYRYVNEAYEKWFHVSRNEIIGKKIKDVIGENVFNIISPCIEKAHKGEEHICEKLITDGDGNAHHVKTRYVPRKNNGFFLFTYDLTEQKRANREKEKLVAQLQHAEKMEAIGQLAGGIAHDFNNILAAILGYAELAKMALSETNKTTNDIDQVIIAGKRATELVKQILTFSRKTDQQKKPFRMDLIVKEALQLLRSSLPATIEIDASLDKEGGLVFADPTNIHQIVINLCTNASHAIGNKKGKLEVTLDRVHLEPEQIADKPEVQAGPFLRLTVKDSGSGMDKKTVNRIFEPYFTTKKQGEGTGLGLAVIHAIVKECNGFIEVTSAPEKGTAFQVYLPTVKEGQTATTNKKNTDGIPIGNERILYIDDEQTITDIGQSFLTGLGYTVTTATNGIEALEKFQETPEVFDLVITDQTMPGLTGVELAQAMFKLRPGLPIILCTGKISTLLSEEAYTSGVKKIVAKPVSMKTLAEIIRSVLHESEVSSV